MAGDSMKEHNDSSNSTDKRKTSRHKLERWLNKSMKIKMTDGRTLIGTFVCTDCDCNIIMGSCEEYLKPPDSEPKEDPRILGLAMVPGKHVVSIEVDDTSTEEDVTESTTRSNSNETGSSGLGNETSFSERSVIVENGAEVL